MSKVDKFARGSFCWAEMGTKDVPANWATYVAVENVDAAVKKATDLGDGDGRKDVRAPDAHSGDGHLFGHRRPPRCGLRDLHE